MPATIPKIPPSIAGPVKQVAREIFEKISRRRPPSAPDVFPGKGAQGGPERGGIPAGRPRSQKERQRQKREQGKKYEYGPGVVKYEDAMHVVESVLMGGTQYAQYWKKLKAVLGASDLDDEQKLEVIADLMEEKILSQKAPRAAQALKYPTTYPNGTPERYINRRNNRGFMDIVDAALEKVAPHKRGAGVPAAKKIS